MTDERPTTSSELAGVAVNAVMRIAQRRTRWMMALVLAFALALTALGFSYHALQKKSTEQTVAEVQLRDDVNNLSKLNKALKADHSSSLQVFCSIAVTIHDPSPVIGRYCPKPSAG